MHARDVVSVEKTIGLFTEMDVQRWALSKPWVLDIANLTYFHAHFAVTTLFMFWLYLRRNHHYYFVRNIIFSAMALALIGYMLFPTAPPRMLDRPRLHRHPREDRPTSTSTPAPSRFSNPSRPFPACTPASR